MQNAFIERFNGTFRDDSLNGPWLPLTQRRSEGLRKTYERARGKGWRALSTMGFPRPLASFWELLDFDTKAEEEGSNGEPDDTGF